MRQGIGTLSEKTVHAVMKNYYAPDTDMHEIPIENFVADIYTGQEIIEIQTRAFNKMRRKLDAFLPLYPVTIVYPIPHIKWLSWIDEETGETSPKRKSPKTGNPYMAFIELYKIRPYLSNPNLHLKLALLDMEEYQESMSGIYTTSVSRETIDEAPQAYKPMDEIIRAVADTVEIEDIIKPIYNFKATE